MTRRLQHPVPSEHLKHIGDITVSFALLESELQNLVHVLLGGRHHLGRIVTAELSFKALRALAVSLYLDQKGEDENYDTFRELVKRAAIIEQDRNQITHSVWATADGPDTIKRFKTTAKEKQGIRFHFEDLSSDQLAGMADSIQVLAHDIQNFGFTLQGILLPPNE